MKCYNAIIFIMTVICSNSYLFKSVFDFVKFKIYIFFRRKMSDYVILKIIIKNNVIRVTIIHGFILTEELLANKLLVKRFKFL